MFHITGIKEHKSPLHNTGWMLRHFLQIAGNNATYSTW